MDERLQGVFGNVTPNKVPSVEDRINEILKQKETQQELIKPAVENPIVEKMVTETLKPVVEVVEPVPIVEVEEEEDTIVAEEYHEEEVEELFVPESEVGEVIEETVTRDADGFIEEVTDVIVYDDKDVDTMLNKVYKGALTYKDTPEYTKNTKNGLLFDISKMEFVEKQNDDALSLLRGFKRMGESLDVFLPSSNIAVRIYEFENKAFFNDTLQYFRTSYDDYIKAAQIGQASSPSTIQQLVNIIKDNCVFLCGDTDIISNEYAFDNISRHDMEILLLGAAALLVYVDNKLLKPDDKTGRRGTFKVEIQHTCEKCNKTSDVEIDLLELMKAQYQRFSKEEIQTKIDNYDIDESYMDKLSKSDHQKKYSVTYTKKVKDAAKNDTIKVILKDPSHGSFRRMEDDMYRYLLSKYDSQIRHHTYEIPGYTSLSPSKKILHLMNKIFSGEMENVEEYYELVVDQGLCNVIPFVYKVEIERASLGATKTVVVFDEETSKNKMDIMTSLPNSLKEKILKYVSSIKEKGSREIRLEITCGKCGHTTDDKVDPMGFFFMLIDQVATNITSQA